MSTSQTNKSGLGVDLLQRLQKFRVDKKPLLNEDSKSSLPPCDLKEGCDPPSLLKDESQSSGTLKTEETNGDDAVLSPPGSPIFVSVKKKLHPLTSDDDDSLGSPTSVSVETIACAPDTEAPASEAHVSQKGNKKTNKRSKLILDEEGKSKEERKLIELSASFPKADILVVQDALSRADWDVIKAKETLNGKPKNGTSTSVSNFKKRLGCNGISKKAKRKRRHEIDEFEEESDGEEDNEKDYKSSKMFDSDADSDEEVSDELSGEKLKVYEFLSSAASNELQQMQNCSKKRAELIIECRPFDGWKDLLYKLQEKSGLGPEFTNHAQDLLRVRDAVANLIEKCGKLADKIETAVAVGLKTVRSQPTLLSSHLKLSDYQLVGLNWLLIMDTHQVNGILADEMGLGKTVQVIAFLTHLKENKLSLFEKPHLVIVPASTLENWRNEFERWCPSMKVVTYYGSQEERKYQRLLWAKNGFGDTEVILTTYNAFTGVDERRKLCFAPFHYAVFDEAHMLKNMGTQRYEHLAKINAPRRILLTGTPLQNNLLELMSLLVFVMPKMFKGKEENLKALFAKGTKQSKSENEDCMPEFERNQISQAKRIMKPFVLRRLKNDVLKDLPRKTDEVIFSAMMKDQEEKYKDLMKTFSKQAGKILQDEEQADTSENGMVMYMKLRRLANHPLLLRYYFKDDILKDMAKRLQHDPSYKDTVFDYIYDDLCVMSDFELHEMCRNYKSCSGLRLPEELIGQSGKFIDLENILKKLLKDEHKVLIFSQFVIVLDILEEYLKICGYTYCRLDGSTPVTMRQELIDEFNKNPTIFIFMLSTRAGGLGINLTSADTVIIHDVDPNPHNDRQAEDRCHRIGQTKPVKVVRLVSKNTIEENIFSLAQEKLQLERHVSSNEESDHSEKKNVASLLKQHLGLDKSN